MLGKMEAAKNRFYVGTARGVLLCTGDKPNNINAFNNDESTEVTAMSEGRNPDEIILGYENGNVHFFDIEKTCFTRKIDNLEGEEGIIGISCINRSVILAKRDGVISIWTNKKNDFFSLDLDETGSLDAMVSNRNRENIVGTGGEANDYKLWDIETKQCIFKAKSLGHDHLQLPIPTSIRGITYFNNEPNLGACCTKEGHILLYDDRAQRKPTVKFFEDKASYTTISSTFANVQVFVGTTKGYMQWLDLRSPSKVLKTYTTFTGCVTDIACDPLEPYVIASVSLDRHLRVHRIDTKELISKLYMKQSLTKLLVKPIVKGEDVEQEQNEVTELDQEYEDLFDGMEKIQDKKKQKRGKRKTLEEKTAKKIKRKRTGKLKTAT